MLFRSRDTSPTASNAGGYRAPHAQPNRLMVRHADALLRRGGRMTEAVEAIGNGRIVWEGEIVELPLSLDEL